jgi:DHA3 family macrolide efflux protein-like MFS transporter
MEEALSRSRYVLLKNEKNYWKSTLGQMFSRCGDGIDTIAFSILIYEITGSTLQVATLFAVNGLPNLIFGMISGVVTQHKSEKVILSICDFGRGLCAFLTAVLYLTGWIRGWQLYIITFLNSSFESFRAPATASVTPKILNKENMDAGIALQTSATKLLEVLGLAVAPALIGLLGLGSAIAIDSILFMICGVFSVTLHLPKVEQEKMTLSNSVNDLKQGFSYLVKRKQLVNICIFTCLINIVFIPINVFQVPYVQDQLHGVFLALPYLIFVAIIFAPEAVQYGGLAVGNFMMGTGIAISSFIIQTQMFAVVEQNYLSRAASIMNMFALCIVPVFSSLSGQTREDRYDT